MLKKLFLALISLPFVAMGSTTWYVNANWGSNAYSGLSSFLPKRTIQAAINGKIDLTKAAVKEEFVKEVLDPDKGAEIKLDPASPTLTTPATRPGLVYTLHEGASLKGMKPGASTVGDGNPWNPKITVKGGACGFYSINATK